MKLKKRIIAGAIAFVVAVSPLQTTFAAFADEINNDSETQVEETQPETHQPPVETQTIQETVVETEPVVVVTEPYQEPDYSEYAEPTENSRKSLIKCNDFNMKGLQIALSLDVYLIF